MDGLSADLRKAFRLGVLERRPYAEIAQLTGWSAAQVKVNIFRARHRVIGQVCGHFPGSGAPYES